MATTYQTSFNTARAAGTPHAVDRQFKLTERQIAETRNLGVTGPTSFQSTHSTYFNETGNQRNVDLITEERQLGESRN